MEIQEKQYYLNQGYSEEQIEELGIGKDEGLDISVYENIVLSSMQMYQIRSGMEGGYDMRPYADGSFDWFQIDEIRKGLEAELDVSLYAKAEISSEKMHEMREGLLVEMDLSDFLKYEVAILHEIRLALTNRIDITNYVTRGYDAEQLCEIRLALEDGLDIPQYLNPELRAVSISEIAEGLRDNVDVEIYAKTCYTWTQMREIRLGLLSQLDVSWYLSPLYDRYQMREIRLGLEGGLQVDEYSSHMYPAGEMKKIRQNLMMEGGGKTSAGISIDEANAQNKDGITVVVSKDDMTAELRFDSSKFGITTRKDILRSLRIVGITQNIDPRMLDSLLAGQHLDVFVTIAKGRPAVNGADGFFEYFFDIQKERKPKIREDGSVDFQNVDWCAAAKKDQKLAYYHSAGRGETGVTVTGKPIPAKRGRDLPGLRGKGMHCLPDKKTYVADYEGRVELEGNKLEVSQILNVPEINLSTGNVRFEGNVIVDGGVGTGTLIEAGGDVVVHGFVEGARIEAGGDVILEKGVNGQGKGLIRAGGSVEGQFFESVRVIAGDQIRCNYSLHSHLYSEDSIVVHGKKGSIIGGTAFAVREIKVHNLGNPVAAKTNVKLGISEEMQKESRQAEEKLAELDKDIMLILRAKMEFEKKYPPEVRNIMDMYIKMGNAAYTLNKQREEIAARKKKLSEQIAKTLSAEMVVTGHLYDNNVIEINGSRILSTDSSNVTVRNAGGRVGIFKNQ